MLTLNEKFALQMGDLVIRNISLAHDLEVLKEKENVQKDSKAHRGDSHKGEGAQTVEEGT